MKKSFSFSFWLYTAISIAVTFILLWLNVKFNPSESKAIIESIIITVEVTFILGLLTNDLLFNQITNKVAEVTKVSVSMIETGITDIKIPWNTLDFSGLINNSQKEIIIVGTYFSTWLNTNFDSLQNFVRKKDSKLQFIFIDPENETTVKSLQDKFFEAEKQKVDLNAKIQESINRIKALNSTSAPKKIIIRGQKFPPTYSFYKFDDKIVIVPYLMRSGRTNQIPSLLIEKKLNGTLYDIFLTDINVLINDTSNKVLFES
jgi:hypothetical protein